MDGSNYKTSEWESKHQIVAPGFYPTQQITQAIWFPGISYFLCVQQSWLVERGRLQMWNPDSNTGPSSGLVGNSAWVTFISHAVLSCKMRETFFFSLNQFVLKTTNDNIEKYLTNSESYTRWVITSLPKNFIICLLLTFFFFQIRGRYWQVYVSTRLACQIPLEGQNLL